MNQYQPQNQGFPNQNQPPNQQNQYPQQNQFPHQQPYPPQQQPPQHMMQTQMGNNIAAPAPQTTQNASKPSTFAQLLAKSVDLQHLFDGEWKNKQGQQIDVRGTMVNQRPIFTVESSTKVLMKMDGIAYNGTVTKNGKLIQWSDGDEWVREGANTSSPHVSMQIEPTENKATMGETPPISGDEEEKSFKKKKNKLKKKKPKKISDGDAKKEIATKIKKWLREQDTGSNKINRDDFKTIAKKCTEKMWKIYQTKRKQKAGLMPKDFLSKRRSGKVIALINKYIEQSKKRNA